MTETTTTTIEVLDPIGTTTTVAGSQPLESGLTPCTIGQQYVDVVFSDSHTDYNIDELHIENVVDNPPLGLDAGLIVYRDSEGFRAMLNASPDSEFYNLRWRITI
jgi:hypothetical protein